MSWETETFPTTIVTGQDHGSYGHFSGSAHSDTGVDAGPWRLTLRHGHPTPETPLGEALPIVHETTVSSRREAEFLLSAWVAERITPETRAATVARLIKDAFGGQS